MILKRYGYDLTLPCQCRECAGECTSLVAKRWFMCRPCAVGYHVAPCGSFVEPFPAHILVECVECGYERGEHGKPE